MVKYNQFLLHSKKFLECWNEFWTAQNMDYFPDDCIYQKYILCQFILPSFFCLYHVLSVLLWVLVCLCDVLLLGLGYFSDLYLLLRTSICISVGEWQERISYNLNLVRVTVTKIRIRVSFTFCLSQSGANTLQRHTETLRGVRLANSKICFKEVLFSRDWRLL